MTGLSPRLLHGVAAYATVLIIGVLVYGVILSPMMSGLIRQQQENAALKETVQGLEDRLTETSRVNAAEEFVWARHGVQTDSLTKAASAEQMLKTNFEEMQNAFSMASCASNSSFTPLRFQNGAVTEIRTEFMASGPLSACLEALQAVETVTPLIQTASVSEDPQCKDCIRLSLTLVQAFSEGGLI